METTTASKNPVCFTYMRALAVAFAFRRLGRG